MSEGERVFSVHSARRITTNHMNESAGYAFFHFYYFLALSVSVGFVSFCSYVLLMVVLAGVYFNVYIFDLTGEVFHCYTII